jgi:hypothetical protein
MDIRTAIDIVEDTAARLRLRPGANAAARGNYAAFVCVMNPEDFIRLTTHGQAEYDTIFSDEFSNASEFNAGTGAYNFNGYYAPFLDVDAKTGRVTGHEGRHRAAMIVRSGGDKFPVMIKLYAGERYYIIGKKIYVDGPDDEPFEIEFPSYEEAEAALEKMKVEGDNLDNDWWYSGLRIKTNYSYVHKGSPAHSDPDSFKKRPFTVADMPKALVGQYDPSVVIPTSRMRFGPVKGYRHFREDAAPQVETAFDRWFAGSQIVDSDGRPLKLYHGTSKDQDFRAFRMPKNGIWFTTDPKSASDYASENDSMDTKYDYDTRTFKKVHTASRVVPVYVKATKVFEIDEWPEAVRYANNYRRAQGIFFDQLRMRGYDAVWDRSAGVIVVIGNPTQIKSAIGNRGTFDPAKKNIDEDVATAPEVAAETVRLYHGTNTALAADIERYGLQATGGEGAYNHLRGLARDVLDEIPPALDRELRRMASYYRTPSIFLTPNLTVAQNHARENPNGGEIGGEVMDAIRKILGVDVELFADAKPCVVAVDVPRSWLTRDITPGQYEVVIHRPEIGPEYIAGIEVL